MTMRFTSKAVLEQLHGFQRATVEHGFRRLYLDGDSTRRFLVADETGLGKTHVARGIIAKTIEHLQDDDAVKRIDIIYVCSNIDIADQNLRKLMVSTVRRKTPATRLTMLVAQPELLEPLPDDALGHHRKRRGLDVVGDRLHGQDLGEAALLARKRTEEPAQLLHGAEHLGLVHP